MKKHLIPLFFLMTLSVVAGVVQSGWTTTGNASSARGALAAVSSLNGTATNLNVTGSLMATNITNGGTVYISSPKASVKVGDSTSPFNGQTFSVTDTNGTSIGISSFGDIGLSATGTGNVNISAGPLGTVFISPILDMQSHVVTNAVYYGDGSHLSGLNNFSDMSKYRISYVLPGGTGVFSSFGEALSGAGSARGGTSLPGITLPWQGYDTSTTANTAAGLSGGGNTTLDGNRNLYWSAYVTIPETNNVRTKVGVTTDSLSTAILTAPGAAVLGDGPGIRSTAVFRASSSAGDTNFVMVYAVEAGAVAVTNVTSTPILKNHKYHFELTFDSANKIVYAAIDGVRVNTNTTCFPTNLMQTCVAHSNLTAASQTNFIHTIYSREDF